MINILPYNQKKHVDRLRMLRVATATIGALLLLVGVAMLLLVPLLVTINSRFSISVKQLEALERSGIVINPVNVAALKTRTRVLSEKLARTLPPSPSEYIGSIRATASAGITLSGYSMEQAETPVVEVAGTASSREALQRFIAALEKDERVVSVESPVSNYVKSTNSAFSVTVTFK